MSNSVVPYLPIISYASSPCALRGTGHSNTTEEIRGLLEETLVVGANWALQRNAETRIVSEIVCPYRSSSTTPSFSRSC